MKTVILLSGGLDSSTVLAIAVNEGYEPYALSFRYGQRHKVELGAAKCIAKRPNSFFNTTIRAILIECIIYHGIMTPS